MEVIHNILSFLAIISILVFIHEFGHYIVAKYFGVKIEVFSIGFGKKLFSWSDRSGTLWQVSLIPIGGYVKMFQDQNIASLPDSEITLTDEEKEYAFFAKPAYAKFLIVAAGPIANFLLAIVIFTFFYNIYGKSVTLPIIDKIQENSSAYNAGLNVGDKILKIDDQNIEFFSDIEHAVIGSVNKSLSFIVERDGETVNIDVVPDIIEVKDVAGSMIKLPRIGIMSKKVEVKKYSVFPAFIFAVKDTYKLSIAILAAIKDMIMAKRSLDELSGPVSIAKYSGESVKSGLNNVLLFMAMLSVNLGLMNLLPIPVLDGGHLVFYLIEFIFKKPVNIKIQEFSFRLGIVFLGALMIFSTANDIKKLFVN